MPQSLSDLEQRRELIARRLTELGDLRPGSITATSGRCGKPECHRHQPGQPGHGPNFQPPPRKGARSRCRSLYPVIMLAINTGMRASEIRGLTWAQVNFLAKSLMVGKSKTEAGTGRIIPLNPRAVAVLTHWRGLFPGAEPEHYVFPHEKYGLAGTPENNAPMKSSPRNQSTDGKWPGRAHARPQRDPAASTICA